MYELDVALAKFDFSEELMVVYPVHGVEDGDMVDNLMIAVGGDKFSSSETMYKTASESDVLTAEVTLIR